MKRWLLHLSGFVLTLGVLVGCKQQCFISEECFKNAQSNLLPPAEQIAKGHLMDPFTQICKAPADVRDPDRPPMYLSLQQAYAIALENGLASGRAGAGSGVADDSLIQNSNGPANNQTDRIRVLAMNPAIAYLTMQQSLGRWDTQFVSGINWNSSDQLLQGLTSFQNGSSASFVSGIVKGMPSGGVIGMALGVDYRMLSAPPQGNFSVLNPFYTARLTLGFEQPLWRDWGTEINQFLGRAPSALGNGIPQQLASSFNAHQSQVSQADGILLARVRFDQARAEFERNVHVLMLNTEVAYWKLYQAYGKLYSFEEVLRLALESWRVNYAKFQAGNLAAADMEPVRGQYEEFRGERTAALAEVINAERNLRGILGLPVEDGTRLVPVTPPTLARYSPDWDTAAYDAIHLRPELAIARDNFKLQEYNLRVAKNSLKPDLRAFGQYVPSGYGTRIGGDGTFIDGSNTERPSNAFNSLSSNHFNDWTIGLNFNMPLGRYYEHALVRQARLSLEQAHLLVKDQEERAVRHLAAQYQLLSQWQELIGARKAERRSYANAVRARGEKLAAGQITPDALLDLQRRMVLAAVKEYEAIAEYNSTIARFEFARGTILKSNNVAIAEGALPVAVQMRAVENEKDRTDAFVLARRPDGTNQPGRLCLQDRFPQALSTDGPQPSVPTTPSTLFAPANDVVGQQGKSATEATPTGAKRPNGLFSSRMKAQPGPANKGEGIVPAAGASGAAPTDFLPIAPMISPAPKAAPAPTTLTPEPAQPAKEILPTGGIEPSPIPTAPFDLSAPGRPILLPDDGLRFRSATKPVPNLETPMSETPAPVKSVAPSADDDLIEVPSVTPEARSQSIAEPSPITLPSATSPITPTLAVPAPAPTPTKAAPKVVVPAPASATPPIPAVSPSVEGDLPEVPTFSPEKTSRTSGTPRFRAASPSSEASPGSSTTSAPLRLLAPHANSPSTDVSFRSSR